MGSYEVLLSGPRFMKSDTSRIKRLPIDYEGIARDMMLNIPISIFFLSF